MSEWLTTGEMIDRLKVGEKAETLSKRYFVFKNGNGIYWDDSTGGPFHTVGEIFSEKWRILPKYVTVGEAVDAYKQGKTIKCDFIGKRTGKELSEKFSKNLPETESQLSMYMIVEGKWQIIE